MIAELILSIVIDYMVSADVNSRCSFIFLSYGCLHKQSRPQLPAVI